MQESAPPPPRPSPADLVRLWREGPGGRKRADDLATEHGYQIVIDGRDVRVRDLRNPDAPRAEAPMSSLGNRAARRKAERDRRRGR